MRVSLSMRKHAKRSRARRAIRRASIKVTANLDIYREAIRKARDERA